MFWQVHSEKTVYATPLVDVRIADVELPDGRHRDHHLVRTAPAAGAVVTDEQDRVLLIWRHRFITDSWGWEIPLGKVGEGEMPQAAAAREVEQKTGWRPGLLRPLLAVQPDNRLTDSLHHVYRAESATHVGPPGEADRIDWIPLSGIRKLFDNGDVVCGTTLSSLLYVALDCLGVEGRKTTFDPNRPLLLRDFPGLQL
ncbi:ADP-ribose pyrophosphatase YjhB (NUDIX family) [Nonomuraea polychroma]|uniref:ADP-ribose pyrophosphatase YjhB (NUDIX family) n=1 Tax=Nonomuraea polychroma TaxID=46176 RepID=A0A438MG09_9ACTN|nr:NUDIX hydrolase [Nonomuraea polychroma]RVX44528.1 ADP-ribose pyrophosphatase YjhB (NUDIX family) [Nonomuraea polychroma]